MSFAKKSLIIVAIVFCFGLAIAQRQHRDALPKVKPSADRLDKQAVSDLVNRCFEGLVRSDDQSLTPSFIKGDFDGDGSMDLFVTVQPGKKVDSRDKTIPAFNFYNVIDSVSPANVAHDLRVGNLGLIESWPLVAIVRNVDKPAGSRCLLKNEKVLLVFPMDKGTTVMKLFQGKKLPEGTIGDPDEDDPPPALKGDAVMLLDFGGDGMAIFWSKGRFRWYPVNDFKEAAPPRYRA